MLKMLRVLKWAISSETPIIGGRSTTIMAKTQTYHQGVGDVEVWKDIEGYEGLYQVSSYGNVVRTKNNRQMKGSLFKGTRSNTQYHCVCLTKDYKETGMRIHRLVAQAFLPNPDNKPVVNHKDGNGLNNKIDNLEWATYSENNQHAFDTGLRKNKIESHLTRKEIVEEFSGKKYLSKREASRCLGIKRDTINRSLDLNCVVCKKYKFRYV